MPPRCESNETTIGISYSRTENGPDPVTVNFTNNSGDSSLVIKYQIGNVDGNWLDYDSTKGVTVEENTSIYARLFDEVGQTSKTTTTAVANVLNIYKLPAVGDFVNYDAGVWTEEDFELLSTLGFKANNSTSLPTTLQEAGLEGYFCGFTIGQSRNTNSTPYDSNYAPDYAGWRVWDIDGDTVTLISAGHSETFVNPCNLGGATLLSRRDCTMYVNDYATSAHFISPSEINNWYNKYIDSSINNIAIVGNTSVPLEEDAPLITVFENGSYLWNNASDANGYMSYISPVERKVMKTRFAAMRSSCSNFFKSRGFI